MGRNSVPKIVAAKVHVNSSIGGTELVGHVGIDIASPTETIILGEARLVIRVTGCGAARARVDVEEIGFAVNVAAIELVLGDLEI